MFANFDYPQNDKAFTGHGACGGRQIPAWRAGLARRWLCSAAASEIYQQAAMLGLPPEFLGRAADRGVIPAICLERMRPDVPYVPNSPFGGAMPFSPNAGVTHYYGVGAYMRPLDDARRAEVRFRRREPGLRACAAAADAAKRIWLCRRSISPLLESARAARSRRLLGFRGCPGSSICRISTAPIRRGCGAKIRSAISISPAP